MKRAERKAQEAAEKAALVAKYSEMVTGVVEAPAETDKAAFGVTAAAADSLMEIFGYKRVTK